MNRERKLKVLDWLPVAILKKMKHIKLIHPIFNKLVMLPFIERISDDERSYVVYNYSDIRLELHFDSFDNEIYLIKLPNITIWKRINKSGRKLSKTSA